MAKQSRIKTISLKEFIKTGSFGGVTIGSTKAEFKKKLGYDFWTGDLGETQDLMFDSYEFFYNPDEDVITYIQNDHLEMGQNAFYKNKSWKVAPWFIKRGQKTTFGTVRRLLSDENISFRLHISHDNTNLVIECVDSNVILEFFNSEWFDKVGFRPVVTNYKDFFLIAISLSANTFTNNLFKRLNINEEERIQHLKIEE